MYLGKLLLTGYQFSNARIPIEYVVVLRGARLAVLYQLDCGRGLGTGAGTQLGGRGAMPRCGTFGQKKE